MPLDILLHTVSVYQHRTEIEARGCYGLGCYKGRVVQLRNCGRVTPDRNLSYFSYISYSS